MDTTILDEAAWYLAERRIAVLTGAGISTESGIPDYRGPDGALRKRTPISYHQFLSDPNSRRLYWARSAVGWPRAASAGPNAAHFALARLEETGLITSLITQNVDGLHQQAGSKAVIELHGSLSRVVCLECGHRVSRRSVQHRIEELNPRWENRRAETAPDGDAEVPRSLTQEFQVPSCSECGGLLKPDVVFFGENVPKATVDRAFAAVDAAEALLIAGTSLTVYSGLRFLDRAARNGIPAVVVNMGEVRGAHLAAMHLEARLGEALPALVDRLIQNGA
ncbi:MAG: NAD-dependent protein deacetylase [Spirochaetota bacterium]